MLRTHWLVACLMAGTLLSSAAAADSILSNAGCEEGKDAPQAWSQGAKIPGVNYVWDKQAGQESGSSLSLQKSAKRYFPIAQWYQVVEKTGDAATLEVNAQVKAEQATKAVVDVIFLNEQGKWISHKWACYIGSKQAGDPPADHDWRPYTGRVGIPAGTKKIQVALQIYGPGKVWFDDINVAYAK